MIHRWFPIDQQNTFFRQKIPSPRVFKTYIQTQPPIESFSFHFHSQTSSGIRKKLPCISWRWDSSNCQEFHCLLDFCSLWRFGYAPQERLSSWKLIWKSLIIWKYMWARQTFMRCLIIPTGFGHPFILCDTSLQVHAKKQSKHILESYM